MKEENEKILFYMISTRKWTKNIFILLGFLINIFKIIY